MSIQVGSAGRVPMHRRRVLWHGRCAPSFLFNYHRPSPCRPSSAINGQSNIGRKLGSYRQRTVCGVLIYYFVTSHILVHAPLQHISSNDINEHYSLSCRIPQFSTAESPPLSILVPQEPKCMATATSVPDTLLAQGRPNPSQASSMSSTKPKKSIRSQLSLVCLTRYKRSFFFSIYYES